jgi:deoxycytidine triphosphate deaminase
MILTKKEILIQAKNQNIILDGVTSDQIKDNSIDASLHKHVLLSKESFINTRLALKAKLEQHITESEMIGAVPALLIVRKQIHYLELIKQRVISSEIEGWHIVDISQPTYFVNGLFVLGAIDEWIGTKANTDFCCEFRLKSTPARLGLDHAFASWIETGYFSRLCLELKFNQSVELQKGSLVGQYIFHKTTDETVNYVKGGSYQLTSNLESMKKSWNIKDILPKSKIKIKKKY